MRIQKALQTATLFDEACATFEGFFSERGHA